MVVVTVMTATVCTLVFTTNVINYAVAVATTIRAYKMYFVKFSSALIYLLQMQLHR